MAQQVQSQGWCCKCFYRLDMLRNWKNPVTVGWKRIFYADVFKLNLMGGLDISKLAHSTILTIPRSWVQSPYSSANIAQCHSLGYSPNTCLSGHSFTLPIGNHKWEGGGCGCNQETFPHSMERSWGSRDMQWTTHHDNDTSDPLTPVGKRI